jgi:hypothetical protein
MGCQRLGRKNIIGVVLNGADENELSGSQYYGYGYGDSVEASDPSFVCQYFLTAFQIAKFLADGDKHDRGVGGTHLPLLRRFHCQSRLYIARFAG